MMEKVHNEAGQSAESTREHRWDVVKKVASAMRVLVIPLVIVFYIRRTNAQSP